MRPSDTVFEAYLELRAQMNDAARAKKQTPPGWEQTLVEAVRVNRPIGRK
jgi:hypothetical protein